MTSFGEAITLARRKKLLSQKELAARIKKDDGESISAQYLNDIERGRRNAPPEPLISQLASALDLDRDHLCLLAGTIPEDLLVPILQADPQTVIEAWRLFRRKIKGK